jgi:RES domain-containing protein
MTRPSHATRGDDLRSLVTRFQAPAFCHAPVGQPFDPAALAEAGDGQDRWNRPGEPTAYLSGDPVTALAESCRHAVPGEPLVRTIVRVELGPLQLLDIRRRDILEGLRCDAAQSIVSDRSVARALAGRVRASGFADGLIVPSMAFIDQSERFNVVVFVERLRGGMESVIRDARAVGGVDLRGSGATC